MNADLAAVIEELEAVLAGMRSAAQLPEGRALTPLAGRLVHNIERLRELGSE